MLEKLHDVPDSIVGIGTTGKVTGDDYRNVLIPAVEAALAGGHNVRLLYVLGEGVKGLGFTPDAAWEDTKVGLGHYSRREKIAVVSGKGWLRHSVNILGYLIPGEVKAFTPSEEAEARGLGTGARLSTQTESRESRHSTKAESQVSRILNTDTSQLSEMSPQFAVP
jgi:hypothetical protein